MDPEKYKPAKRGKSDFFSWQFYLWMKKKPDFCRIYKGVWNSATGYDPDRQVLYVGLLADDCFMGNLLRRVCSRGDKIESWAFCSKEYRLEEWQDITDQFFKDYEHRGVCAIHGDMAHKWPLNPDSDIRVCEYCGVKQIKKIEMVPQESWEPLS
jgi:deoxyadenosine/deoxycytidine kinase